MAQSKSWIDLPINSMVDLSTVFCNSLPEGTVKWHNCRFAFRSISLEVAIQTITSTVTRRSKHFQDQPGELSRPKKMAILMALLKQRHDTRIHG